MATMMDPAEKMVAQIVETLPEHWPSEEREAMARTAREQFERDALIIVDAQIKKIAKMIASTAVNAGFDADVSRLQLAIMRGPMDGIDTTNAMWPRLVSDFEMFVRRYATDQEIIHAGTLGRTIKAFYRENPLEA